MLSWQVKENFERFISCKSTIDDIHVRLRKAEGDYGDSADGASTTDMVAAVTDVSFCQLSFDLMLVNCPDMTGSGWQADPACIVHSCKRRCDGLNSWMVCRHDFALLSSCHTDIFLSLLSQKLEAVPP